MSIEVHFSDTKESALVVRRVEAVRRPIAVKYERDYSIYSRVDGRCDDKECRVCNPQPVEVERAED